MANEALSVRMYRGLLGDCFLLRHTRPVTRDGAETVETQHILIDCGVLQCMGDPDKKRSTARGADTLRAAVDDIVEVTGGVLNLVIATHEHYDHLSGFILAFDRFKAMTIREVWLGWTENPNDKLANDIRENGRKALNALKAIAQTKDQGMAADERVLAIKDLMQFYDEDDFEVWSGLGVAARAPRPAYVPAKDAKPRSCANVIEWLKVMATEANVKYLDPGQIVTFGVDNALKAYVLGPPRRADRLLQMNPTEGATKEVYLTRPDDVRSLETVMRFKGMQPAKAHEDDPDPPQPGAIDRPFSDRFNRDQEDTKARCPIAKLYYYEPFEKRRIDGEWLGTAEALALKVDSDVNNTSLALAIEAPGASRHVMVFPGDAQVGNWLSWGDQRYPAKPEKADTPTEAIGDILGRAVLYKVGHHGSHNATARAQGLELMTSPHLVALIPVVEDTAREQTSRTNKRGWAMPYAELNTRLKEKTQGRILQGDGDPDGEADRFKGSIFGLTYERDGDPASRWVEVTLPLGTA